MISLPLSLSAHAERKPCAPRLTKNRAGRDGLPVEPEGDLGQDDSHDAGQVGLDHKVPDLPLQVEVRGHDDVFACRDSQGGMLARLATPHIHPAQSHLQQDPGERSAAAGTHMPGVCPSTAQGALTSHLSFQNSSPSLLSFATKRVWDKGKPLSTTGQ